MKVDMSPQAISTRLKRVSQLRELCFALAGPRLKRPWGVPAPPQAVKEHPAAYRATSGDVPGRATNLKMN